MLKDLMSRLRGGQSDEGDSPGAAGGHDHGSRRRKPPKRGERVLEVEGLRVDFGVDKQWVPAAMDMKYHVDAGEVLAIVGESGSGKSASSMALLGLLPSNSGCRAASSCAAASWWGCGPRGCARSAVRKSR